MNVFDLEGSLSLDTKAFKKSIEDAKKAASDLGKGVQTQSDNFVEMQKELGRLANELDAAKKEIDKLRSELDKNADSAADMTDEVKKAKKAMDDATDSADELGKEEKKTTDKTDDYTDSARKAKDETGKFDGAMGKLGDTAKDVTGKVGNLAVAVKDTLVKSAEIAMGTIGAASAAIAGLTKSAMSQYGEYGQLVGGVDTLFGVSSEKVQKYAEDAYKTAGMSSIEYMETVTSFSASLLQGLGGDTDKAADMADMAIRDMSDNANKMGTNMQSIQNAYQGFAKQNYTMLDNLKLGYGGTKEEMNRLIEDANKLRHEQGINNDLTIDSYADVIEAVHTIQTEIGITGTTSKEAAGTIQGSAGSMKAAWQNLVTELGKDNGDIAGKFDALVESASTSFDNIVPRIQTILENIGKLIEQGAPIILPKIGALAKKVLPGLVLNGTKLALTVFTTIAEQIPVLAEYILPQLPLLWAKLKNLGSLIFDNVIKPAWAWVTQKLPGHINTELKKIDFKKIGTTMSDLIKEGLEGIADFVEGIDWEEVGRKIGDFIAGIDWKGILEAAVKAIVAVIKATPDLIGGVIEAIGWEDAAAMAGVLFAPKLLGSIADELGLPGKFDKIKSLLGEKTIEGAEDFGGAGVGGTKGFGSMFVTGIQAFLVGWSIGTWIYDTWGPEIDAVLFKFFDKVDAFVSRAKKKIGNALGVNDSFAATEGLDPNSPEYKQAVKQDKLLTDWNLTLDGKENQKNFEATWGLSSAASAVAKTFTAATLVRDALDAAGKRPKYESFSSAIGHATGGLMISSPVLTTSGHLFGEAGREAILPLDNNTGWIDELAAKLGRSGGGVVVQTLNLNLEGMRIASDYDTDRMIERISERLENLKVSDLRGVGGVRY